MPRRSFRLQKSSDDGTTSGEEESIHSLSKKHVKKSIISPRTEIQSISPWEMTQGIAEKSVREKEKDMDKQEMKPKWSENKGEETKATIKQEEKGFRPKQTRASSNAANALLLLGSLASASASLVELNVESGVDEKIVDNEVIENMESEDTEYERKDDDPEKPGKSEQNKKRKLSDDESIVIKRSKSTDLVHNQAASSAMLQFPMVNPVRGKPVGKSSIFLNFEHQLRTLPAEELLHVTDLPNVCAIYATCRSRLLSHRPSRHVNIAFHIYLRKKHVVESLSDNEFKSLSSLVYFLDPTRVAQKFKNNALQLRFLQASSANQMRVSAFAQNSGMQAMMNQHGGMRWVAPGVLANGNQNFNASMTLQPYSGPDGKRYVGTMQNPQLSVCVNSSLDLIAGQSSTTAASQGATSVCATSANDTAATKFSAIPAAANTIPAATNAATDIAPADSASGSTV